MAKKSEGGKEIESRGLGGQWGGGGKGAGGTGRLTADGEPLHQGLRKPRAAHAGLHGGNIVGDAPKLDGVVFEIGDGEAGAWIAVARLTDRTGIKQVPARRLNGQSGEGFGRARANLQNLEIGILVGEAPVMVRMAEESDFGGGIKKAVEGLRGRKDIFVFILKRPMDKNNAVGGERSLGES